MLWKDLGEKQELRALGWEGQVVRQLYCCKPLGSISMRRHPSRSFRKKLREQEPREPPSPGQAQMRFPPTPSTPGGARRKPEVYQIEKAQRQNTFLPSWEEKAEGAEKSKERGQVPAQPQVGMGEKRAGGLGSG